MLTLALGLTVLAALPAPAQNSPLVPLAEISAPGGVAGISFGQAIALEGDLLVVGAPRSDLAGPEWGAAFVYRRDARTSWSWRLVQTLLPPVAGFGGALALKGGTLVVGTGGQFLAVREVHVYSLVDGLFELQRSLPEPRVSIYSTGFGRQVAADGEVVAVSRGDYECYTSTGPTESVFVYERDAGGPGAWGQVAELPTTSPGGKFGNRIDIDGDVLAINEPWLYYPCQWGLSPVFVHRRDAGGPSAWGSETGLVSQTATGNFGLRIDLSGSLAVATDFYGTTVFDQNGGGPGVWGEIQFFELRYPATKGEVELEGSRLYLGLKEKGTGLGSVDVYERHQGGENAFGLVQVLGPRSPVADDGFGLVGIEAHGSYVAVSATGNEMVHVFGPKPVGFDLFTPQPVRQRATGQSAR